MAPLIGKDMSEAIFLERFASLCVDPLFHVRKVCAANFGDFSSVVGMESTEKVLLPKFFYLCEDGVWGVRKACADVFMPVSCVCSPNVRKTELSPVFVNLLKDQSRWVRMTAYQALGPFISTFADSNITSLLHNDNGEIVITDRELLAQRLEDLEAARAEEQKIELAEAEAAAEAEEKLEKAESLASAASEAEAASEAGEAKNEVIEAESTSLSEQSCDDTEAKDDVIQMEVDTEDEPEAKEHLESKIVHSKSLGDLSLEEDRAKNYSKMTTSESFNNFLFWRDPLPDLPDLPAASEAVEAKSEDDTELEAKETLTTEDKDSADSSTMELFRPGATNDQRTSFSVFDPNSNGGQNGNNNNNNSQRPQDPKQQQMQDPALPKGPPARWQKIVPQLLVDHFVSMTDPSRAQTVDSEIAHHCAFSLPAVALTLGRNNWPLLKETYDVLASDMQWKVRRTLASSIHELGVILGEDAVIYDLIPIFNGFLKDLDEVRIGLLKHLSDFLKLLPLDLRRDYLPKMSDFLYMDNDRNWRFRQELTEQMGQLIPLFTSEEVKTYLAPIAVILIKDKVAAVRTSAVNVHSIIVKTLLEPEASTASGLVRVLLADLVVELAKSESWIHRQTYGSLALTLFQDSALEHTQFGQDILPNLLDLAEDKVPNVRLMVARALKQIRQATYFTTEANPNHARMDRVIAELSEDKDADVRAFFQIPQAYDSDGEPIGDISSLPV